MTLTKREFTTFAQSVYNPTGIVAPFNLKLKLLLRDLWKLKLRWDEQIPAAELTQAFELVKEATQVNNMMAPRNLLSDDGTIPTLRNYTDASEQAIGVVAYYCSSKGNFLLLAKTWLARQAAIPELELDALLRAATMSHELSAIYLFANVTICGDSKLNP